MLTPANLLKPSNVQVKDIVVLTNAGAKSNKQVSFMVGTHGPFVLNYTWEEYSSQKVKDDINKQVADLRDIESLGL